MKEAIETIDRLEGQDGSVVEILQFTDLKGSADVRTAENLHYAKQSGMRLKMVKVTLKDSSVRLEPGAVYFMRGELESEAGTSGGLVKGIARKFVSGETLIINQIKGVGEVYLEPTFGHFLLHELGGEDDAIVVDKSLFYAGTGQLEVTATRQRNVSSALFGGEGLFQTRIAGNGIAVIYSPVPKDEVHKVDLAGDKLFVDGNFALMRSDSVEFRAERSSKGWMTSAVSGEGLYQTFQGEGSVWIAPTQGVYEKLRRAEGLRALAQPPGSSQTKTQSRN